MQCPTCRAEIPDTGRFCASCGQSLGAPDAETVASDPAATMIVDDATRIGTEVDLRPLEPGVLLDQRYRIVRLLGHGGMGEVYRADDLRLAQPVALKFLPPALSGDAKRLAQFHNEVRLARQISHPNVCRVYDIVESGGRLFLSMEFVDGEDLAAVLKRQGRFPEESAIELCRQICAGLAAVHAIGVLHRDLKPANIMIARDGRPLLMDFGLAAAGSVEDVREGTPAYMAPEQLRGESVTVQSDLYALGLVMYQIFTGTRAVEAKTLEELMTHHASGVVPSPNARVGTLNPSIERAVTNCLDRDPAKRPASVAAAAAMLETVLLDAEARGRRWVQVGLPTLGAMLIVGGLRAALPLHGTPRLWAIGVAVAGTAAVALALRFSLWWNVSYKGHAIRFQNHPIWGERLYIDGALADRGRPGVNIRLRGTIESGDGAGERITSESRAALLSFRCRLVVESFLR